MKTARNKTKSHLNTRYKIKTVFLNSLLLFSFFFSIFLSLVGLWSFAKAQSAISLGVTPPILEVMLQPGKELSSVFTVTNLGGNTAITPRLVYFEPADELGNVKLLDKNAPSWARFDKQMVNLASGASQEFRVLLTPPKNEPEIDHNLSLVFETAEAIDVLNQNSSFYKVGVAANILVTISKDGKPHKAAQIVEFSAPRVIDSIFGELSYIVEIKNSGNSFWKPNGKIVVNNQKGLTLAPQNVLSGYSRQISCLDNETIIQCKLDKPFWGLNKSKLEFSLDNQPQIYSAEATTLSFPFTLAAAILILLLLTKYIIKVHIRKKP